MNIFVMAIVLALLAAALDWWIGGIKEPWRKCIFAGVVILLVVGLLFLLGVLPLRLY